MMNKNRMIKTVLPFLFGFCFMVTGLCLFGMLNDGASLGEALTNPAYWIFGFAFGIILALGTRQRKTACHENSVKS